MEPSLQDTLDVIFRRKLGLRGNHYAKEFWLCTHEDGYRASAVMVYEVGDMTTQRFHQDAPTADAAVQKLVNVMRNFADERTSHRELMFASIKAAR